MKRLVCAVILLYASLVAAQTGLLSTSSTFTWPNDPSTGTTVNLLAKITPTAALTALTTDTDIPLWVVTGGAGITGSATLQTSGPVLCIMDATTSNTAGFYVLASTIVAGRCHAQAAQPTNGFVIGIMTSNATSVGAAAQLIAANMPFVPGSPGAGSGTVNAGTTARLAYYPSGGDGTTVDDLPAVPTAGRALKGDGTNWVTSTVDMAGAGACTNQVVTATVADAVPTCTTLTSAYVNTSIAQTGVDINTSHQVTGGSVAFALKGDLTPTALSGNVNDYNPATLSTASVLRIDGGAASRNITGVAGGADGRVLTVMNIGTTNNLVLTNEDAASAAGNRFLLGSKPDVSAWRLDVCAV